MCNYCEGIKTLEDYLKLDWFNRYDQIVYVEDTKEYNIITSFDDPFNDHFVISDISFCPVCGERLKEKEE